MEPTVPTLAPSPRVQALPAQDAVNLLRGEVRRIAQLVERLPPHTAIPGCSGWTAGHLVHHVALLQAWVTRMVAVRSPERMRRSNADLVLPAEWSEVPAWFTEIGDRLTGTLAQADPDAPMYAWGPDKRVRFWIRRMLAEATVHRADLEDAAGEASRISSEQAVDLIDELLENLPYAGFFRPAVAELHGDGETIHLHATDLTGSELPGEWLITLEPEGYRWSHSHVKGAVAVRGPITDLALFMYGRRAARELDVIGDTALLAHWSAKSAY